VASLTSVLTGQYTSPLDEHLPALEDAVLSLWTGITVGGWLGMIPGALVSIPGALVGCVLAGRQHRSHSSLAVHELQHEPGVHGLSATGWETTSLPHDVTIRLNRGKIAFLPFWILSIVDIFLLPSRPIHSIRGMR
jgi:hypothetical protein